MYKKNWKKRIIFDKIRSEICLCCDVWKLHSELYGYLEYKYACRFSLRKTYDFYLLVKTLPSCIKEYAGFDFLESVLELYHSINTDGKNTVTFYNDFDRFIAKLFYTKHINSIVNNKLNVCNKDSLLFEIYEKVKHFAMTYFSIDFDFVVIGG